MNFQQYLFTKLAEEATEVAQISLKTSLFGTSSTDPREVNGRTNLQKMGLELLDMVAVLELLREHELYDNSVFDVSVEDYLEKKKESLMLHWGYVQQVQK